MIDASEVIKTVKLKLQSVPVDTASFVLLTKANILTKVKAKLQIRPTGLLAPSTVIAKVRESLGDTVETYRWSTASLTAFLNLGIDDIKQRRADAGDVTDCFATALYFYVLARAYDADSGVDEYNSTLSQVNDKKYLESLSATLYLYSDTNLNDAIDEGLIDIKNKRTDANYDYDGDVLAVASLRDGFISPLCYYVLARAYQDNNVELSQVNEKLYFDTLNSVLCFYPENILLDGINNGVQEVLRFRPDAALTETGLLRDAEIVEVIDDNIDLPVSFKNAIINYAAYEAVLWAKRDVQLAGELLAVFNKEIMG